MTCLQNTCVGFCLGALGSGAVFVVTWLFFGLFGRVLGRVFRDWVDHFSSSPGAAWDQSIDLCHFKAFKTSLPLCVLPRPLLKPWRPKGSLPDCRRSVAFDALVGCGGACSEFLTRFVVLKGSTFFEVGRLNLRSTSPPSMTW